MIVPCMPVPTVPAADQSEPPLPMSPRFQPLATMCLTVCLLAGWIVLPCPLHAGSSADPTHFEWKAAAPGIGTSAGRAFGTTANQVFGIGGTDGEGEPVADVEILEQNAGGGAEIHRATLSRPLSHASAVGHGGKVYVIGGMEKDGPTARVFSLEWKDGGLVETELTPLPSPRMLAGAAIHRSTTRYYLFSIGGTPSMETPEALAEVLELLVEGSGSEDVNAWQEAPGLPQGGRIAPMSAETFNEIVVAGGYAVGGDGRMVPTVDVHGYSRLPRDGHDEAGWRVRAPLAQPLAASATSRSGQSHLLVLGGDTAGGDPGEVFGGMATDPSDAVLSYHALTDTWTTIGRMPSPAAGGFLAPLTDANFLFAGAFGGNGDSLPPAEIFFKRSTRHLQPLDYSMIALFFLIMVGQGAWFAIKKKTAETYSVGGGSMKWWATAISLAATGVSSISFLAIPALVASVGPVAISGAVMIIPATLVSAYITFPLLRRLNLISIYEYLEMRYGPPLRFFGSFNSIVTLVMARIGLVILLPSLAISSMVGLDPVVSILAIGVVTTVYSALGGFEAVVWTDVLQGVLLFSGFLLLGVLAFMGVPDGLKGVVLAAKEVERDTLFLMSPDPRVYSFWFVLLGSLLGIMNSLSDQQAAQRVVATPLKDVRRFAFSFGALSLAVSLLSLFIGLCLVAYFRANPRELSPVMKNEQLVPLFMVQNMPVGVAGFILAAIFAASMSTVSSGVNSCSVLMAEDFYRRLFRGATRKRELLVMKIGTVCTGAVGTAAALWLLSMPMPTLWETFNRIMALLAGGFGGVFILGFFTRRANMAGAIVGVVTSAVVAYFLQFGTLDVHWSTLGIFIILTCVIVGYVASLCIPSQPKDLTGLTVWNLVKARVTDEELLSRADDATPR